MDKSKILLVDDEKLVLATMSVGLQKYGYEVLEASSAKEARELIAKLKPDLAVLDVNMPEENGIELGKWLLKEKNIPFIFLTGYGDKEILNEGIEAGALSYLIKPVEVNQLAPAIEVALQRAQDNQELMKENEQLSTAMDSSRAISIAIGIIMARKQLTKEAAFNHIRQYARSQRVKVNAVADEILRVEEARNNIFN